MEAAFKLNSMVCIFSNGMRTISDDQTGDAIVDERILVSVDEANTLRVFKQTSRSVYSCTPACEEHVPTVAANP